jgi:hypothetical protein
LFWVKILRISAPVRFLLSVAVVRRSLNDDRHAARRVTFVNDLVELFAVPVLARTAFDRALDIIAGHALRSRSLDRAA